MAFNVFLVFFFQANPDSFRGWLWLYCLICFGGPAIPAIACLLLKFPDENNIMRPIYGDATVGIQFVLILSFIFSFTLFYCCASLLRRQSDMS